MSIRMEAAWLFLPVLAAVASPGAAQAGLGTCYRQVEPRTGVCSELLLDQQTTQKDCCRNPNFGFKPQGKACIACRKAYLSEWSDWSPCGATCAGGVSTRAKTCIGVGGCGSSLPRQQRLEVRLCNHDVCCPELGRWGAWGQWSECSPACGTGNKHRTRICEGVHPCGVRCPGPDRESVDCETGQICPTHGAWGEWTAWGECSKTCQDHVAVRKRSHRCNNPAPSAAPAGMPCPGPSEETGPCLHLAHCPVDGGWGPWSRWSECGVTCGLGTKVRTRLCDSPTPQHGGRQCSDSVGGRSSQEELCSSDKPCPVDGKWGEWSEWSWCASNTPYPNRCRKRPGKQTMQRLCVAQDDAGAGCEGIGFLIRACYNLQNCTAAEMKVDKPEWGEWGDWSLCRPPCGQCSRSVRRRTCKTPLPPWPNVVKSPTGTQVPIAFWGTPLEECEPKTDAQQERRCPVLTACPRDVDDGCNGGRPPHKPTGAPKPPCGDGGSGDENGSGDNAGDVDCEA